MVSFIIIGANFRRLAENEMFVDIWLAENEMFVDIWICGFDTWKWLLMLFIPIIVHQVLWFDWTNENHEN